MSEKIDTILDSGDRTVFSTGSVRGICMKGKVAVTSSPMCVLLRLARHYENGCKKYRGQELGEGNPRSFLCICHASYLQVHGRAEG